jgi:hypothetical protein
MEAPPPALELAIAPEPEAPPPEKRVSSGKQKAVSSGRQKRVSSERLRVTSSARHRAVAAPPEASEQHELRVVKALGAVGAAIVVAGLLVVSRGGSGDAAVVADAESPGKASPKVSPKPAEVARPVEAKPRAKEPLSVKAPDRAAVASPGREPAPAGTAPAVRPPESPAPVAAAPGPKPEPDATDSKPKLDAVGPAPAPAKPQGPRDVVEQYASGKIKARYHVEQDDMKEGSYVSYFESGKIAIRATYKGGVLSGAYEELLENGKPRSNRSYKNGVLQGRSVELDDSGRVLSDLVFVDGHVSSTKSPEQIAKGLAAIEGAALSFQPGKPTCDEVTVLEGDQQIHALRRLLAYRFLCDLPTDVTLDFSEAERAAGGAKLLAVIGGLSHRPPKPPGVSDKLYKLGFEGTSHGNLRAGPGDVTASVDDWIDDSDGSNSALVGHRRWCLDPAMKHVGFGQSGIFSVMFAHDGFERKAPHIPEGIVAWPPRGYCPTTLFRHGVAWSVSLDPRRYGKIPSNVRIRVRAADESLRKGADVEVKEVNVNLQNFGAFAYCATFKAAAATGPGDRYWVTVLGITDLKGKPVDVEYFVEFYKP